MISLLSKLFIKNREDTQNQSVRKAYGMLCGAVGILFNLLLFAGKLTVGVLSGSIAATADAVNNLSDAASSVVTLISFRMSSNNPDTDHPFGHGRIEYISGLIISMIILLMAFELLKSSVQKIITPEPVDFSVISIIILCVSVLVKLYMYLYNKKVGAVINSPSMKTVAADSLSDCITTSVVIISMVVASTMDINVDGIGGVFVSLFIFYVGFGATKETISPLLGQPIDKEYAAKIEELVMSYDSVIGIHDLVVHDYGPGRRMISLHAEVPSTGDFIDIHDEIDNIEKRLREELCCEAVIHMDPIAIDDMQTASMRIKVADVIKQIDASITIHDFRIVTGPTHTNVIFDAVVPFEVKISDKEIKEKIEALVHGIDGNCYAVVHIDKSYIL